MPKQNKEVSSQWRLRNPEYHTRYYEKNSARDKVRRFNKKNGFDVPDSALEELRDLQEGCCSVCGEKLDARHEYIFAKRGCAAPTIATDVEVLCLKCRRIRRAER